jgi:hypothetical protein
MAAPDIQLSNVTGLRVAREASLKVLPGSPNWVPADPNSFSDFGGEVRNLARTPIRDDRQQAKGVTVALSAAGGWNCDYVFPSLKEVLPSFFYAAYRTRGEFGGLGEITGVTTNTFTAASGLTVFEVGKLVLFAGGSKVLGNNGLKRVTTSTATVLTVAETMVAETPPAGATLVEVGQQFAAGDVDVSNAGPLPTLTRAAGSWITDGYIFGEWIYIGGDPALTRFTNAANNGWKRVRSVTALVLTLDKSQAAMVTEADATQTIQIFYGRVLKNEQQPLIVRQSVQLEMLLGTPDAALPAQVQSQYVIGAVGNELTFRYKPQDKLMCDLALVACDVEYRTGVEGVKSGNRPALQERKAFNTSSSVRRVKLSTVSNTNVAPVPLAGSCLSLDMSIKNNVKGIAVIGTLGYFELVAGDFEVTADSSFLFVDIASCLSVRNNADATLDMIQVQDTTALAWDMPLVCLGDGRANVEKDEPITIPFSIQAASGQEVDDTLDHTLCMCFFDFVPVIAQTLT